MNESESQRRRRLISLGEAIALAALMVSAVGVWISWKASGGDKPARVVEQHQSIPLTLRGVPARDGRALTISPAESSHALESLTLSIAHTPPIEVGGDGELNASNIEAALRDRTTESKDEVHSVPIQIRVHYVEAGTDKLGGGIYRLRYRWEGGGLFGGRSLRLVGLIR